MVAPERSALELKVGGDQRISGLVLGLAGLGCGWLLHAWAGTNLFVQAVTASCISTAAAAITLSSQHLLPTLVLATAGIGLAVLRGPIVRVHRATTQVLWESHQRLLRTLHATPPSSSSCSNIILAPTPASSTRDGSGAAADSSNSASSNIAGMLRVGSSTSVMAGLIDSQKSEDVEGMRKPAFSELPQNKGRIQVLSVDDEFINQKVLQALLWEQEFDLVPVTTGEAALEYIVSRPCLPDIVLLDLKLTGMSGFEVAAALRAVHSNWELPIIMTTCSNQEEDVIQGLQLGANDYMTKPLRLMELMARIRTQVALKKSVRLAYEARLNLTLLRSILPPEVIAQLKAGVSLIAKFHRETTILFSDIRNFTVLASEWPTEKIILMLNDMFTKFDLLCETHGVYKVETIGDAYMIVSGHDGTTDHAARMIGMARSMLKVVSDMVGYDGRKIEIRIGIHTGSTHSGVVGLTRPRYCFFGDTVNTASRMESNGFPMTVHLSAMTAMCLEGTAGMELVECGPRDIKGKGVMVTYLLKEGKWQDALEALHRGSDEVMKGYIEPSSHALARFAAVSSLNVASSFNNTSMVSQSNVTFMTLDPTPAWLGSPSHGPASREQRQMAVIEDFSRDHCMVLNPSPLRTSMSASRLNDARLVEPTSISDDIRTPRARTEINSVGFSLDQLLSVNPRPRSQNAVNSSSATVPDENLFDLDGPLVPAPGSVPLDGMTLLPPTNSGNLLSPHRINKSTSSNTIDLCPSPRNSNQASRLHRSGSRPSSEASQFGPQPKVAPEPLPDEFLRASAMCRSFSSKSKTSQDFNINVGSASPPQSRQHSSLLDISIFGGGNKTETEDEDEEVMNSFERMVGALDPVFGSHNVGSGTTCSAAGGHPTTPPSSLQFTAHPVIPATISQGDGSTCYQGMTLFSSNGGGSMSTSGELSSNIHAKPHPRVRPSRVSCDLPSSYRRSGVGRDAPMAAIPSSAGLEAAATAWAQALSRADSSTLPSPNAVHNSGWSPITLSPRESLSRQATLPNSDRGSTAWATAGYHYTGAGTGAPYTSTPGNDRPGRLSADFHMVGANSGPATPTGSRQQRMLAAHRAKLTTPFMDSTSSSPKLRTLPEDGAVHEGRKETEGVGRPGPWLGKSSWDSQHSISPTASALFQPSSRGNSGAPMSPCTSLINAQLSNATPDGPGAWLFGDVAPNVLTTQLSASSSDGSFLGSPTIQILGGQRGARSNEGYRPQALETLPEGDHNSTSGPFASLASRLTSMGSSHGRLSIEGARVESMSMPRLDRDESVSRGEEDSAWGSPKVKLMRGIKKLLFKGAKLREAESASAVLTRHPVT